jgi:hypothetical protein
MGTRTSLAAIVVSSTHNAAAFQYGRNTAELIAQAQVQVLDIIATLRQAVKDATAGNASDSNIATINTLITNLS